MQRSWDDRGRLGDKPPSRKRAQLPAPATPPEGVRAVSIAVSSTPTREASRVEPSPLHFAERSDCGSLGSSSASRSSPPGYSLLPNAQSEQLRAGKRARIAGRLASNCNSLQPTATTYPELGDASLFDGGRWRP